MTDSRNPSLAIAIAELVEEFGAKSVQAEAKKHASKPGRPKTRKSLNMESEEFLVWLAVERYRHDHPRASVLTACKKIAESGGVGFAQYDTSKKEIVVPHHLDNYNTIRRIYSEARSLRIANTHVASAWNRALDDVLGREHRPEDIPPRITGTLLRKND